MNERKERKKIHTETFYNLFFFTYLLFHFARLTKNQTEQTFLNLL